MHGDEHYMLLALEEARKAYDINECPVGAVIVNEAGDIIGRGYNTTERDNSPLRHAELIAIEEAAQFMKNRRLTGCTLYVTLEPCAMCAGAISNTRIKRLVYGAFDEKGGMCASVMNLYEFSLGHKPMVRSRVLADECGELLSGFFKQLRA